MATPDRQLAEELFAARRSPAPAPAAPPPNDETEAKAHARSRAEPQDGDQEEEGGPDFRGPYRAFGRAQHPLPALVIYFNAAERRKYGKKKVQVQYEHLDSDDPASEGLAEDGQSFSFVVAGARKMMRVTVRGRQLEQGYDLIISHRMPWIRCVDRDFGQADGQVITSVEMEAVQEAEM
jgi:hypothetical protein